MTTALVLLLVALWLAAVILGVRADRRRRTERPVGFDNVRVVGRDGPDPPRR